MLNVVPVAGQSLGASRDLISQNFSVIDTAFTVNHVPYNDGSGNQGKHAFVQFNVLGSAPTPIASDISMYNFNSTLTGLNELFIVKADGTTTTPMTASDQATTGWTYLPSGLLLKWGTTNAVNGSNPFVYTYPTSASTPVFNAVYSVMISAVDAVVPFSGSLSVQSGTVTTTGFSVVYNGTPTSTTAATYLAIGK
jgi:hypothetical protein